MQTHRAGGPPWHRTLETVEKLFPVDKWDWSEQKDRTIAHPSGLKELAITLKRCK